MRIPFIRRTQPYSQAETDEQLRQAKGMPNDETREIAHEILKFMLDANVTYLKGK